MHSWMKKCCCFFIATIFGPLWPVQANAAANEAPTIDIVHFWISESESSALDVYKEIWLKAGKQWADIPAKDKVDVQKIVSERVANGYPPAVMQWNANEGSRELPEMGILLDIDKVAQEDNWADVLPRAIFERISYKNKVYFAPINIHAENWLWTSKVIFENAQLEVPKSWDDIFAIAEKMKTAGVVPVALGGSSWEISLIFNNIMFHTMGAEGYSAIIGGNAEPLNRPEFTMALNMLRQLSAYVEPLVLRKNRAWTEATAMVGRGEAAMQFMGDWAKGELLAQGYSVDEDFDCNLVPGTAIAYFMVVDAFAFPQTNRKGMEEEQREFARVVMRGENQIAFNATKGAIPARTDVNPAALDRCGQRGLEMLRANSEVNAQSMAMPIQMSEGWIAILAKFFNDPAISVMAAQQELQSVLRE